MSSINPHVAVIGAGEAGLSCASHLQNHACDVTIFDAKRARDSASGPVRHGVTIFDIWYEDGWRLASLEHGTHDEQYAALVLALPPLKAAELLNSLLPMTALHAATMAPQPEHCIWLPAVQVGLCGDWLCDAQGEGAWLSGRALATLVLTTYRVSATA